MGQSNQRYVEMLNWQPTKEFLEMSVRILFVVLSNTSVTLNVKLRAASVSISLVCGIILYG